MTVLLYVSQQSLSSFQTCKQVTMQLYNLLTLKVKLNTHYQRKVGS